MALWLCLQVPKDNGPDWFCLPDPLGRDVGLPCISVSTNAKRGEQYLLGLQKEFSWKMHAARLEYLLENEGRAAPACHSLCGHRSGSRRSLPSPSILPDPLLRHLRFFYNSFGHASPKPMALRHFCPYLQRLFCREPANTSSQVPAEPSGLFAPQRCHHRHPCTHWARLRSDGSSLIFHICVQGPNPMLNT